MVVGRRERFKAPREGVDIAHIAIAVAEDKDGVVRRLCGVDSQGSEGQAGKNRACQESLGERHVIFSFGLNAWN